MKILNLRLLALVIILFYSLNFVVVSSLADMAGHGGMVRTLDISYDGSKVLSGSFDFTARLWNFADQNEIAVLDAHSGPVTSVAFIGDGSRALTASDDRTAILWDLQTFKPLKKLKGHSHKVMGLAVSANGALAVTGSWDHTVRLWDLNSSKTIRIFKHTSPVNTVLFAYNDNSIIVGGHNGKIQIWDIKTGNSQGMLEGHFMGITGLSISSDGRRLLSASIDKSMRLWDLISMKEVRIFRKHEGQILAVALSPDSRTALSAGLNGNIFHWDLDKDKPIKSIDAHDTLIWALKYTPDGRFALTGSSDESIRVWHLNSGDRIGVRIKNIPESEPWLHSNHPGASLFKKCARCHSINANSSNRSGPHLAKLFGRTAGSVAGYNYSDALKGVDFKWNEETLFQLFDQGPDKFLPGTKMPVQKVPNTKQLIHLVEYLKGITGSK